jgi:hypothetical protein
MNQNVKQRLVHKVFNDDVSILPVKQLRCENDYGKTGKEFRIRLCPKYNLCLGLLCMWDDNIKMDLREIG